MSAELVKEMELILSRHPEAFQETKELLRRAIEVQKSRTNDIVEHVEKLYEEVYLRWALVNKIRPEFAGPPPAMPRSIPLEILVSIRQRVDREVER